MRFGRSTVLVAAFALVSSAAAAAPIVIGFDDLSEFDAVTNQYAGLTFSNATVLTAGSALNDIDFPPHSGSNVVVDDAPISILFSSPILGFGGYFTYNTAVTLTAYDSSNHIVGLKTSLFSSNLGSDPGSIPNEFLQVLFAGGISSVKLEGDPLGGSFALDDATITPLNATTSVPEPGTLALVMLGSIRFAHRHTWNKRVDNDSGQL